MILPSPNQRGSGRLDIDAIRAAVKERAYDVATTLLPNGVKLKDEWWTLNPLRADKHLGSFSVNIEGDKASCWKDLATDERGDLFHLVMRKVGCDFLDAARYLARIVGIDTEPPTAPIEFPAQDFTAVAEWKKRAANGTLFGKGCRLVDLAEIKRLPVEYLQSLGLREHEGWPARGDRMAMPCHVEIPYLDASGKRMALRRRSDIRAGDGSTWKSSSVLIPYGLERLSGSEPYLLIVEGESDCWCLWRAGIHAIGLPGASTWKDEWSDLLPAKVPLFLVKEPDAAGGALAEKLSRSPIAQRVRVVGLPTKDAADLWTSLAPDTAKYDLAISEACARAKPLVVAPLIEATPYVWRDPASIPRREWIYGTTMIRGFLSLISAPGGAGKTALSILDAIALATGRDLAGQRVHGGPKTVWLWNLEDPRDEIERRIAATVLHHGIDPKEFAGRLFVDSGRDQGLCTAIADRGGVVIQQPIVDALTAELKRRGVDVLMVDPFVSSHQVPENDNGAIDRVAKEWGKVAHNAHCAVRLAHHVRKTGGGEATAESVRGGKALVDAARSVLLLNRMLPEEAEKAGLDSHLRHFRQYDDKNNLAPAADRSEWFRFVSVALDNGDNVGVAEPWHWPDPFADSTTADLDTVCAELRRKDYREDSRSSDWAGVVVAQVLNLDLDDPATRHRIKAMLRTWTASGALEVVERKDSTRRQRKFIVPKGMP